MSIHHRSHSRGRRLVVVAMVVIAAGLAAPATVLAGDAHAAAGSGGHAQATVDRVLAQGAGYRSGGSIRVRRLQRQLRDVGYRPGPIDGRFGPLTGAAVTRFQRRQGLVVDELVGPQTTRALRRAAGLLGRGAGYAEPQGSPPVRALQVRLRAAGLHPGAIDGRFGPLTEAAVRRFQRRQGLSADGLVGRATDVSLRRELQQARGNRGAEPKSRPISSHPIPAPPKRASSSTWHLDVGMLLLAASAVLAGVVLLVLPVRLPRWRRRRGYEPAVAPAGGGWTLPDTDRRFVESPAPAPDRVKVVGYACGTNGANGRNDHELRTQVETIASECGRRGLELLEIVREREPDRGKWIDRPGLGYALKQIEDGEAGGLVVTDLSRVTRSVADLGQVLEWFSREDARLVAAAQNLDTGERAGLVTVRTLMTVSAWERERLGERTRRGLAAAHRKGRPCVADIPELRERIARMRAEGMTLQAIADQLNAEGVPTVRGGAKWRTSSMQSVIGYRRPPRGARTGEPSHSDEGGPKD